jgi:hypothetical protein
MGDKAFVSRGKDRCEVHLRGATVQIDELRVRTVLNPSYPYLLVANGGSTLKLTDRQALDVIGEFLRYTLPGSVDYRTGAVDWEFACVVNRAE